ncbi:hypothetical protein B5P43_21020 [Bacillus sp. SRB_336]|jgi:hypothetical protein|nr:hypothetical protein B5P43_21020 [Bacillus sp. SRB_336]
MTKQPCTETAENPGEIERSVLAYLHHHPQAADTLRGIVNWWLPQQRYESGCQRIERVLTGLVARGVLRRDPLPHGDVLYALNHPAGPSQSP